MVPLTATASTMAATASASFIERPSTGQTNVHASRLKRRQNPRERRASPQARSHRARLATGGDQPQLEPLADLPRQRTASCAIPADSCAPLSVRWLVDEA
jgi:hypothetical protein